MEPIDLRAYETSDLDAIHALDCLCFEPPFRFSRDSMRHFAEAENALVRLAYTPASEVIPEQLKGFCIVHIEATRRRRSGYIVTLDVAPAWRGQGVAQTLIVNLEAAAAREGCRVMNLHVFTGNSPAIRLYQRLGYTEGGEASGFYGSGLNALAYGKVLSLL